MATFRVTVQEAITSVGVTTDVTVLSEQVVGVQGPTGLTGATGATGAQGSSGVVSVTSPITNAGTSSAAIIGINQSLLSIAPAQVTGTAYTRLDRINDEYRLANTYDIYNRIIATGARTLGSGNVFGTAFTPSETFTVNNISVQCVTGAADVGGTTIRRMGLFTVSGTTVTLVARTASDSTLFTVSNTIYTRALSTVGGFPASYVLSAGTYYMFAPIAYNTGGTFGTSSVVSYVTQSNLFTPYSALIITGQSDLPTAPTVASIGISMIHARLS